MQNGYFAGHRTGYTFRTAIDSIINGASTVFKDQIATLIGEKIQLFDGLKLICDNTFTVQKQGGDQAA